MQTLFQYFVKIVEYILLYVGIGLFVVTFALHFPTFLLGGQLAINLLLHANSFHIDSSGGVHIGRYFTSGYSIFS